MNHEAARLYAIVGDLGTTNRRIVQRDETGSITGIVNVPTNVPRLVQTGIAVVDSVWSHQPPSVDELARLQQLDAARVFCVAAAEQVPEAAAPLLERARRITNAIRLHYDDAV